MRPSIVALAVSAVLTGGVSGSRPDRRTMSRPKPAKDPHRNDTFGGTAMAKRGLPC